MTERITLSAILFRPLKGAGEISFKSCRVGRRGLEIDNGYCRVSDHEYMVVDERGMFVAQRQSGDLGVGIRSMCLVKADIDRYITFDAPELPRLVVNPENTIGEPFEARIWKDTCLVEQIDDDGWFTKHLSKERPGNYRLVRMHHRNFRGAKTGSAEHALADAYPFMAISEASLAALNNRIEGPLIPMNRFRPTLVFSGCDAHEEDRIKYMYINNVMFAGQKLCDRCPVPNIDQATAKWDKRPTRAMLEYRKIEPNSPKVYFGRNFNHLGGGGIISCGDEVDVLEVDEGPFA